MGANKDMPSILERAALPAALLVAFVAAAILMGDEQYGSLARNPFDFGAAIAPYALGIGAAVSAALLADRLIKSLFWDFLIGRVRGRQAPKLLVQIGSCVPYVVAFFAVISLVFKQPVTGLFATTGAIGIVLGFALRNIILDAFSGVAMNLDESFSVGDWIEIRGRGPLITGRIEEMHWRTTRLRNREDNMIVVPNSELGSAVVTNLSRPRSLNELSYEITLDHSLPIGRVLRTLRSALLAAVGDHPGLMKIPEPLVRISGIDDLGVKYSLFWTADIAKISPSSARHHVLRRVLDSFRTAGLQPAVRKQDVFQSSLPDRVLDSTNVGHQQVLLSRVELFSSLAAEDLNDLSSQVVVHRYDQGDWAIRAGDPGDSMFVVTEGLLHVFMKGLENGEEKRVAQVMPGDFFGEMSLLTGVPRSASIQAATEAICFEITKEAMARLFTKHPDLARRISRKIARRQLRNDANLRSKSEAEQLAHAQTFAAELLGRMKRFFGKVIGG